MEEEKKLIQELSKISKAIVTIIAIVEDTVSNQINNQCLTYGVPGQDTIWSGEIEMFENFTKKQNANMGNGQIESEVIELQKGSITKRKDNRWMGRYYDADKKQRCVYARTKKECIEKLKQALKELDKQKDSETTFGKTMTLNAWFDYWLNAYKSNLKESTLVNIKSYYSRSIEQIGKTSLNKLTANILKEHIDNLPTQNQKGHSYSLLSDMLDKALDNGLIKKNPMKLFVLPKSREKNADKKKNIKYLMQEEIDIIFKSFENSKYLNMVKFALYTGLRAGELSTLTWQDIDFVNKTITVDKQFNITTKKISDTKTEASNRTIPLFSKAEEVLLSIKKKSNFVFGLKGFSATCTKKSKEINVPFSAHSLRHTFANICRNAGVDDLTIQAWLGHDSVSVTRDTYFHSSDKEETEAIKKLELHLSDQ